MYACEHFRVQILREFRDEFRDEIRDIRENMATKGDLTKLAENMATKGDLTKLAENMATKGDLGLVIEAQVRPDVARTKGDDYATPYLARSIQDLVDQLPLEIILSGPEELQVRSSPCLGFAKRFCLLPWLAEFAG